MFVMRAQADEDADVVKQGSDLQHEPLAGAESVLLAERVEHLHRQRRDVAAVVAIESVFVPEGLCAGEDLVFEVLGARGAARVDQIQQHPGTQRCAEYDQLASRGLRQQRAVDEQGGNERLGFRRRQSEPLDQLLFVEPFDLIAERKKRVTGNFANPVVGALFQDLRRRETHVAADRHHVSDPPQRGVGGDLINHVRDRSPQERQLHIMGQSLQVELLPQPHRAERVHCRSIGLALMEERQAGAAAADLDEQGPCAAERRPPAESLLDGQEDQPALLGLVDDLEGDAGAALDPVEKQIDVARFTNRAGRHRPHAFDVIAVDDPLEALERGEGRVDGSRSDRSG